jgi:hypothetical protein
MSRVRELANHMMRNPEFVKMVPERAGRIAELTKDFKFELPTWDFPPFYPQSNDFEEMCLFYLLFNSINYCYFDEYGNTFQDGDHRASTLTGLRITENWEQLKDLQFLSHVDETYFLGELFKAETPISLVKERVAAFREIGKFVQVNTDFTFRKMFAKHYNNAYFISQMIPTYLNTWRDPFFKRAQLFVGMVQGRFQDQKPFSRGLEDLTVFADYRVPQTLHSMGIIRYGAYLLSKVSSNELIPYGSKPELEIRAATIVGADMLTAHLNKYHGGSLNALHTDFLLWSAMRRRDSLPPGVMSSIDIPHHCTMTTDY